MSPTLRRIIKYILPTGAFVFFLAAAVFVFSTRSGSADAGQTDDEGYRERTRDEEAFSLAKNTGNKYVYDPETAKWVLLSDAGKTPDTGGPAEVREPEGESGAQAAIAEYLEKAKRAFSENDLKAAREYADKVIELEGKNRQAQFLLAKIDEAENPTKADSMSREMEEARAKAQEIIDLKKNGASAKAEAKEEEKPLILAPQAPGEKVTFAAPKKITAEAVKKPAVDISVSMEEARLKLQKAKEEERIATEKKAQEEDRVDAEKKDREEEEAAQQKQQLVSAYLAQGENSLLSGDFEDSRDYARNALEIIPESDEARDLLTRVDTSEDEYRAELKREADEQVKQEEDRITAEEKAEDERLKAEEEATRIAAEEKAREAAQRVAEEERLKEEEERLAAKERAQEELRIRAEEYAARMEAEEASLKEEERIAAEKKAREEEVTAAEKKAQEEALIAEAAYREETPAAEEKPAPAKKASMAERYRDKARENLEKENFNKARKYAVKAVETGEEAELSRDLLAEIDSAEGLYREQHGIVPEISTAKADRSADEALRRQLRLEAKNKRENIEIRKDIKRSREYLEAGDYKNARKYAYKAWQIIPHDTQVAVLIADINKEEMFGSGTGREAPPREEGMISDIEVPAKDDPLKKDDESKSLADLGGYLLTGIFEKKTFDLGAVDTEKEFNIEDCVEIAIKDNPRMRVADEQVKLAEMRVWETRRKLLPEVTLKHEISYGKISDPGGGQPGATRHYQGKKFKADIKQNLFNGFETFFEIRQMQTNLDIIKLERRKVRNEIVDETKKAYFNLDKAIKAQVMQGRIKGRMGEFHELMEKAFQQDLVSRVDYLKTKSYDMKADFQVISGREDVNLAEMILFQAMNMEPDKHIKIKPVERPTELLQIGLQNCYNLALANSPDFKIKEKTIEYYNFERKMKKAKGWPKIDFESSIGKAWEDYQPMRDPADWGTPPSDPIRADTGFEPEWYAGLKASIPFGGSTLEYNYVREFWATTVSAFRGSESATSYFNLKILDDLAYYTGVQEARVGYERSKYEYIKAKKDLAVKVKETYFKYRKSLIQMNVAQATDEHQKMYVAVLEERRKYGEMDISRLVEEYEKLGEAEYGVLQGDTDYFISITELNTAIGVADYFDPWARSAAELYGPERISDLGDDDSGVNIRVASAGSDAKSDKAEKYIEKARRELDKGKFDNARNMAIKAIELDPGNEEARSFLATVDQAEGMYREGREKN